MLEMVLYTIMFAVAAYGLITLGGIAGSGSLALVIAGIVFVAAVLAGLLVSYQNTRQRLTRMEQKLDELLERQKQEARTK